MRGGTDESRSAAADMTCPERAGAAIVLIVPIVMPLVHQLGIDPVHFGIIMVVNMEIGMITPPVGLNLYVINGITPDIPLQTILRGSLPYVLCMVLALIILCLFPAIVTWLPDVLMGRAI